MGLGSPHNWTPSADESKVKGRIELIQLGQNQGLLSFSIKLNWNYWDQRIYSGGTQRLQQSHSIDYKSYSHFGHKQDRLKTYMYRKK